MKSNLLILCFLIPTLSLGQIIEVKQDSTGDFTTIQAAINASSDGDTVLVWPGIYFENVDFAGKNITLASRMLTTGDPVYKYNTIIDGNHSGSCVLVKTSEENVILFGFTLQNGNGYLVYYEKKGGGVFINNSKMVISNCRITNNTAIFGGGIYCTNNTVVTISNVDIFSNHAYNTGGGISISMNGKVIFDTINKCNIYLNYASRGVDIYKSTSEDSLNVIVDTFTVLHPDTYFLSSIGPIGGSGNEYHDIIYDIQHQKITPADTDLYVNPVTGNDSNSGLTAAEPLKTIAFAYSKIIVDSTNKNTIHLANGIYSDTLNGEKFPLNIRPYINVVGENREGTVLDGEYKSKLLKGNNEVSNYSFSKMTLRRGTYVNYEDHFSTDVALAFLYYQKGNIIFDSILFSEGHSKGGYGSVLSSLLICTMKFKNCIFSNNKGDAALRIGLIPPFDTCIVNTCIFNSNKPDINDPDTLEQTGRGFDTSGDGVSIIINSLFINNDWEAMISPYYSKDYLINCTFTGNSFLNKNISFWFDASATWMYNCIVYENGGNKTFALSNVEHDGNTVLTIKNSLIQNGAESVTLSPSCNGDCFLYYDSSNIDTDPLFYGGAEFPYNLSAESPCIDAGTLDLPQFILDNIPATDLAGNPRIFNGKIDMGAYEWNPPMDVKQHRVYQKQKYLTVAPNPFRSQTTVTAQWDKTANITVSIYNNSGLRVKILQSGRQLSGSCQIPWDGTDDNGNYLPAGVYYVVLSVDGKERESVKVVKR